MKKGEVGMRGWKECKLAKFIKIKHGFAFSGKNITDDDTGKILITPGNFHIGGGFKSDKLKFINSDYPKEYEFRGGDIIVTMTDLSKETDALGYSAKVPSDNKYKFLHNQRVGLVEFISNSIERDFIYWLMRTYDYHWFIVGSASGTSIMHTSPSRIGEYTFNCPPLPEQKAIARVLSSLDDKIDLLHRQNKTLEAMAETLFRQWFVEPCKNGLPKGWEEGKIPDEFAFTMGQSPVGTSFNEDKIGMPMFQGNADFGFRFPSERVYTTEPTRLAEPLDTLISVRAPVGEQNMAIVKCCIGRGVAAFRYSTNKDYYTYTYFKIRSLMTEIKQFNDEGTVFGSIGKSDFEAINNIIPPQSIIQGFEQTAKPVNDKIINNCYQIRTLEKLRDTLLPKLMSGEVRVINE